MSIPADRTPNHCALKQSGRSRSVAGVSSVAISLYICTWIIIVGALVSPELWHWFVIPVWACGVLIGIDAVDWVRRRIPVFDPVGIIGLLGFHFFFLAPLLHVHWDHWMRYVSPPDDWKYWLGWMSVLNFLGLIVYRYVITRNWQLIKIRGIWKMDDKSFPVLLFFGLLITLLLQFWVYSQHEGTLGYIRAYDARVEVSPFTNMGWLFMLSESFPILLLFGYVYHARKNSSLQTWQALVLFLVVFFVIRLYFGGLRGSRSNTIWALFWALGAIHLCVRPVSYRFIALFGLPVLLILMYLGGLYKALGSEVIKSISSASTVYQLAEESGRDHELLLLADFGRSDVQALVLSRLFDAHTSYELALGRTYAGALALFVPRALWPDRPPSKIKEGTEILYGKGLYEQGVGASRVYGLAGETMLNFGPWFVPAAFVILGLMVTVVKSVIAQMDPADSRLLFMPLFVNLCFVVLISDSDNISFFIVKNGFLPILFVFATSRIVKRRVHVEGMPQPLQLSHRSR
jgi:hypothetical protein